MQCRFIVLSFPSSSLQIIEAFKSIFNIERSNSLVCYVMKIVTDFDLGLLEPRDEGSIVLRNVDRAQYPETLNLLQRCSEKHRPHKRDLSLRCTSCGFMDVRFLIFNIRVC